MAQAQVPACLGSGRAQVRVQMCWFLAEVLGLGQVVLPGALRPSAWRSSR